MSFETYYISKFFGKPALHNLTSQGVGQRIASAVHCAELLVPRAVRPWTADIPVEGIQIQPRRTIMFTPALFPLAAFSLFGKGFAGLAMQFEPPPHQRDAQTS